MEELVKELSKLHILLIRDIERNTNKKFITHRDMERILQGSKLTITYSNAVENLVNAAKEYGKNNNLVDQIISLKEKINSSEIKDLRFGTEPQKRFTELESKLDTILLQERFKMLTSMLTIAEASEITGIPVTTIKTACLNERLLNTRKSGRTWLVSLEEVKEYWNK